jgi:parvulin-like peptidyl-prolyl isomerase
VIPLRKLAAALLALVLLAGCGGDEEIGRVGGSEIHLSDMDVLFEGGAVPGADFRVALFRLMAVEILSQSLEADFGVSIQPEQVEGQLAELEATLAGTGQTPAQYLGMDNASPGMLRLNAEVVALRDVAMEQLLVAPDVVEGLFTDPAALTTVCSRHILVGTEEEAEAALDRLAAGDEFATVAGEVSLDSSVGGELGCLTAGAFVPEYAEAVMAAVIDEATGPVATDYGYHVIVVYERHTPTREEYLADPTSAIPAEALSGVWADWFAAELTVADAWVSPEYGTWTAAGILAPSIVTATTAAPGG